MEKFARDIPIRVFSTITKDTPINPQFWQTRGIDTESPIPDAATHAHGIVTVDDPTLGRCLLVNKDGDGEHTYFNLIGGAIEDDEAALDTFLRELREETSINPQAERVSYIGLAQTDRSHNTPIFRYHFTPEETQSVTHADGSEQMGFIPLSAMQKHLPKEVFAILFS